MWGKKGRCGKRKAEEEMKVNACERGCREKKKEEDGGGEGRKSRIWAERIIKGGKEKRRK